MVRLFSLSLLALFAGAALAEQQVLDDSPIQVYDKWSYENCGSDSDPIEIKSIKISPDPPKPGQDLTVTVSATANKPIEEGAYADVVVKLGLIKLLKKRFDVCEEARNADIDVQCPVKRGDYVVSHTVALPREIPQAKFSVNVQGFTKEEDDLLCLNIKLDFMRFPFPHIW